MLRFLGTFVLAFLSSPLLALEFSPATPDSRSFIRVRTLQCTCAPVLRTDVTVNGSNVVVTPVYKPLVGGGCGASCSFVWLDAGMLPAGAYNVTVPFDSSAPLIVRDAASGILVSPVGGPAEGKRSVQVFGAQSGDTVLFDGIPAPAQQQTARDFVVVTPPPHAPGTVDVTVINAEGTRKAVAAYSYFDPEAPPDPFVFEPLLFPVAYDGPGIFGSEWRTENRMATGPETLVRFRRPVPAKSCAGDCNGFNWSAILSGQSQSGLLIWTVRRRLPLDRRDELRVSSGVNEVSRPHGAGTGLPVARERDFRDAFVIDGVPFGGNTRVTLRLWSLVPNAGAGVMVNSVFRPVQLSPADGVAFAAIDLKPSGPQPGSVTVTVTGMKIWGVITVTDNETQEVTALWPQ